MSDFYDASNLPSNPYDSLLSTAYEHVMEAIQDGPAWTVIKRIDQSTHQSTHQSTDQSTGQLIDETLTLLTRPRSDGSGLVECKGIGYLPIPSTNQSINQSVTPFNDPSINQSTEIALRLYTDRTKYRPRYDKYMEHYTKVEQIDRLTCINHIVYKAPWPLSKRESLLINRTQRLPDGSLLDYATSIDQSIHQSINVPPNKSHVRFHVHYYGVKFTPISQPTNQSIDRVQLTYVSSTDSLGGLPVLAVNQTQSGRAADIADAHHMIEKHPEVIEEARQELKEEHAKWGC